MTTINSNYGMLRLVAAIVAICLTVSWTTPVGAEILPAAPGNGLILTGYSASTGEVWMDDWYCAQDLRSVPQTDQLTSAKLISANSIFVHHEEAASVLTDLFDRHSPNAIFKLNLSGFGVFSSLGRIAEPGLTEEFLLGDLEFGPPSTNCGTPSVDGGLSYFPMPNLSIDTAGIGDVPGIVYKAVNGEVAVDLPSGMILPWIGLYSAGGIFENTTDREIASRVQYQFDIDGSRSFGAIALANLSADMLQTDLSVVASDESNHPSIRDFNLVYVPVGDLNADTIIDVADIDLLSEAIRLSTATTEHDLNRDSVIDGSDRDYWVRNIANTYYGDANLDGEFNSSDLTTVFQAGEYFDNNVGNSTWATGDWNGDGEFTSKDFVKAFVDAGYEKGRRAVVNTVPEAAGCHLLVAAVLAASVGLRRAVR